MLVWEHHHVLKDMFSEPLLCIQTEWGDILQTVDKLDIN